MNDCTLYDMQLATYAAGELNEPELGAVQDHLERCAACRAELDRERELRSILGSLPLAVCPASVTATLAQRIDSAAGRDPGPTTDPRSAPHRWRWPAVVGLAAAAVLAVLLVPGLWQGPPSEQPVARNDASASLYSDAEIDQARRDVITTLALAADILDRSRDKTVVDVFGAQLPRVISGSLRSPASDAQEPSDNTNAAHTGGKG
jgi:hypothetical protein